MGIALRIRLLKELDVKLYDLQARQNPRPRILGLVPDGHRDGWVEFDHIDGMYSYCVAFSASGEELGVCHLSAHALENQTFESSFSETMKKKWEA